MKAYKFQYDTAKYPFAEIACTVFDVQWLEELHNFHKYELFTKHTCCKYPRTVVSYPLDGVSQFATSQVNIPIDDQYKEKIVDAINRF